MTTLRRPGVCAVCAAQLPAASRAFYDPTTRAVSCAAHQPVTGTTRTEPLLGHPRVGEAGSNGWRPSVPAGPAPQRPEGSGRWGERDQTRVSSARAFADAKADAYTARVRARWGFLAPLVLLFAPADAGARAAAKGAAGEEQMTRFLDRIAARSAGRVVVLHDRTIPGRRENIDHLVVSPSGVWSVDAKAYSGLISTGGRWARRRRLSIGRRDGDKLVAQVHRQVDHLTAAYPRLGLPTLPTHGALCFVDGEWGPGAAGSQVEQVWVLPPRRLRRLLTTAGPLTREQVAHTARLLDRVFRPATR